MDDRARIVGTGHDAVGAADAQVVVDGHQAVGALCGGLGRADFLAGRIGAVHAGHGQEAAAHVGKLAGLDVEHAPPLDSRRCRIGVLAGRGAGLAADAAAQVDGHHIAGHACTFHTLPSCAPDLDDVGAGAGGIGQLQRHRRDGVQAGHVEVLGEGRGPVVELAEDHQGVGADSLQPAPPRRRSRRYASGPRRDRLRRCRARRRAGVHDHAEWPRMFCETSRISSMPTLPPAWYCMLLLASSQSGKSSTFAPALTSAASQRPGTSCHSGSAAYSDSWCPTRHLVLVQAVPELAADAQQALLVGQLVAQALLFHGRGQVPLQARHRHGVEAVLLEPGQVVGLPALRQRCRRWRAADRVPDLSRDVLAGRGRG
jgi:hypothetical protein